MRKMKDSGIEWIGQIPESWSHCEIKRYCVDIFSGATPKTDNPDYWDGDINWIPSGSCHDCRIDVAPKKITQSGYENSSTKLIPANTAIVAMTGATCGNTGYLMMESCANQSVTAYVEDKTRCNSIYLWYVLQAAKEYLLTFQTGGAQGGINVENCKNIIVPLVPLEDQLRIAEFLDKKCAEIDALIASKEKINELLKERRQSIIYEAVTKGLNPNVPMKDSGIEWIGEIPESWNVIRAKYFATINNGTDPKTEGDIPVYGSGSESFKTCGEYKEGPCVLIGRKGATLHIPHYIEGEYWNVDTAFDVKTDESICLLKYYYYASICFDYKLYISTTTLPGMTQSNYGNIFLPIPSIDEQKSIVLGLEGLIADVDGVIEANTSAIEKLKEYRQSIIYEAVTGKIEV